MTAVGHISKGVTERRVTPQAKFSGFIKNCVNLFANQFAQLSFE